MLVFVKSMTNWILTYQVLEEIAMIVTVFLSKKCFLKTGEKKKSNVWISTLEKIENEKGQKLKYFLEG